MVFPVNLLERQLSQYRSVGAVVDVLLKVAGLSLVSEVALAILTVLEEKQTKVKVKSSWVVLVEKRAIRQILHEKITVNLAQSAVKVISTLFLSCCTSQTLN